MFKTKIIIFRNILILLSYISLASCDNPTGSKKELNIDAGEDQTTYVGSYAILDPSNSNVNETIDLIEWIQDESNPEKVYAFSHSTLQEVSVVGFQKEGTYKFTLQINCGSGNVYEDVITVIVNPRQKSLIEDLNLEILARYAIKYPKGELCTDKLMELDSLSRSGIGLKNKVQSIEGIESCSNLTYLGLANESITDLAPLSSLIKLEYLNLNQNYTIEDISPIYNLTNLKTLIIYSNPITDISGLGNLTKLIYLDILGTPISDISSLANLVNLEILYFDGAGTETSFYSLEPLANLVKLRYLDIAARGITDIQPLANLTELVSLNVSYNDLIEISAVSNMKKLIRLYIRKSGVEDIAGIRYLENLDYLDAADNQIKDISELQYLPNIHLIGLSGNQIEDILPLLNNAILGTGVYLFLTGNPLNEESVNEYIPALVARGVIVNWL